MQRYVLRQRVPRGLIQMSRPMEIVGDQNQGIIDTLSLESAPNRGPHLCCWRPAAPFRASAAARLFPAAAVRFEIRGAEFYRRPVRYMLPFQLPRLQAESLLPSMAWKISAI